MSDKNIGKDADVEIDENTNLDYFFTPEIIASLDKATANDAAGKFRPADEVFAELEKRREEWVRKDRP